MRLEIQVNDTGSGCMGTIMIPGLYDKAIPLVKGQNIIMQFTPTKMGKYPITCAMGVPRGAINVIQ